MECPIENKWGSVLEPSGEASSFAVDVFVREAQERIRRGEWEWLVKRLSTLPSEALRDPRVVLLQDVVNGQAVSQQQTDTYRERVVVLERELRLAAGLMALLLLTGVWGMWSGAVPPKTAGAGGLSRPVSVVPMSKRPVSGPYKRRPLLRRVVPRPRAGIPPIPSVPAAPGMQVWRRSRRIRRRVIHRRRRLRGSSASALQQALRKMNRRAYRRRLRKRRTLRRKRRTFGISQRRRGRLLRFGQPALPWEVPPSWCGPVRVYGPYYPCLKRDPVTRRCMRRSSIMKYGCLRKRR